MTRTITIPASLITILIVILTIPGFIGAIQKYRNLIENLVQIMSKNKLRNLLIQKKWKKGCTMNFSAESSCLYGQH